MQHIMFARRQVANVLQSRESGVHRPGVAPNGARAWRWLVYSALVRPTVSAQPYRPPAGGSALPPSLLIRNARVVTMDPQRRVIADGYVAVEGDTITAVGEMAQCPAQASTVVDASASALLPGFVDSHVHSLDILLRGGPGDDRPL